MSSFGERFRSLDKFPTSVNLTRRGEDEYKTNIGAVFSFIMILSVFAFAVSRMVKMVDMQDPNLTITELVDFYDDEYIFEGGDDFKYAVYISDYDGNAFDISKFGEIRIEVYGWDLYTYENLYRNVTKRNCTLDDFGLGDSNKKDRFHELSRQ